MRERRCVSRCEGGSASVPEWESELVLFQVTPTQIWP